MSGVNISIDLFPVMGDSSFPLPVHFQVILGSDPEHTPGAVQVSMVLCPSARGGTVTLGFWLRADRRDVCGWGQ